MSSIKPTLVATQKKAQEEKYIPSHLEYPDIRIPNRSLAFHLDAQKDDSADILRIKNEIAEYNAYIDFLTSIPSFWSFLNDHGQHLTSEQLIQQYGEDVAQKILSFKKYHFETDLCVVRHTIFVTNYIPHYQITLPDSTAVSFRVSESSDSYPKEADNDKRLLWNWVDNDLDFTFFLWDLLDNMHWTPPEEWYGDNEPIKSYDDFRCWDQARYCREEPDPNIKQAMNILTDMGYLQTYQIEPDSCSPWFYYRGTSNGTIGLAVLDMSFEKNALAREKIKLVLSSAEDTVKQCPYILTNASGHQYLSAKPGQLGGHCLQKIYGKLDCPSALHYIQKGQYIRHRVFFADEETATSAGYRPCSRCMKEAYQQWKKASL